MQSRVEFREDRINAFVCDVTVDNLLETINPSSVDVITLVRVTISISVVSDPASGHHHWFAEFQTNELLTSF